MEKNSYNINHDVMRAQPCGNEEEETKTVGIRSSI